MRWHRPKAMKGRRLPNLPRRPSTLLPTRPLKTERWIWELSMRVPRRLLLLLQKCRPTMAQRPMRRPKMPPRLQARPPVLVRQHPMRLLKVPEQMSVVSEAKVEHRAMQHPNLTPCQTLMLQPMPKQLRAMRPTKMPARRRVRRSRLRQLVAARVERKSKERRARRILRCTKLKNLLPVSMLTLQQGMMIVRMKTSYRLLARIQANSSRDPATSTIRVRPLNRGLHAA